MKKFLSSFKSLDFFGATLVQDIDQDYPIYKSIFGGIMTFLISSASLSYAIWVAYQWQTNQFSPKISSSVYASNFELLDLNYEVIQFYYYKPYAESIDPFEEKILLPLIIQTENYTFSQKMVLNFSNQTTYSGNKYIIPKMKLAFTNFNGVLKTSSEMFILIIQCKPEYLGEGEQCASEERTNQFFKQGQNMIELHINYKQLNSQDGSIQKNFQEFYIHLEQTNCYILNTYLESTLYEVKDSLLFGSPKNYEFINGAFIQSQTNTVQYQKQIFGDETYAVIYIGIKGNQIKTMFEYPNAGDLLANIGSIISVLFTVKYVILFLNSYYLNEKIIHDMISFYYPQFSKLKIYKNWKRDITKVVLHNQQLELKKYLEFYQNTKKIIEHKLTFINMFYEISRLYILIRATKFQDEITKCHSIGLKLDHLQLQSDILSPISYTSKEIEEYRLNDEDVQILSLQERQKYSKMEIADEEINLMNFYDINKVQL